jgi:hypothetical protein
MAPDLLDEIRAALARLETAYRARFLPPLSRMTPRHDPDRLHVARTLEAAARDLDGLSGRLRSRAAPKPGPADEGTTEEFRRHAAFLRDLLSGLEAETATQADADGLRESVSFLRDFAQRGEPGPN